MLESILNKIVRIDSILYGAKAVTREIYSVFSVIPTFLNPVTPKIIHGEFCKSEKCRSFLPLLK